MSHRQSEPSPSHGDLIRLVLADDHEMVRHGLRAVLEGEPDFEVVGEADSVRETVRQVTRLRPDVVLVDLDLPDGSGVSACQEILQLDPAPRVLILTAFADLDALAAAQAAGAAGFILKRITTEGLVEQIRKAAASESGFLGAPGQAVQETDPLLDRLTRQERRILGLIAEGKTNKEIADELFLAEKTVKNYVSNLLAKMNLHHRSAAAAYAAQEAASRRYPPSDWPGSEAGRPG